VPRNGITTIEAAKYVGCSAAALRAWRKTGQGPRFYCAGRLIRYKVGELDKWIARNSYSGKSTSTHTRSPGLSTNAIVPQFKTDAEPNTRQREVSRPQSGRVPASKQEA